MEAKCLYSFLNNSNIDLSSNTKNLSINKIDTMLDALVFRDDEVLELLKQKKITFLNLKKGFAFLLWKIYNMGQQTFSLASKFGVVPKSIVQHYLAEFPLIITDSTVDNQICSQLQDELSSKCDQLGAKTMILSKLSFFQLQKAFISENS